MCKYIEHYSNKSCTKNIRGKKMKFKIKKNTFIKIVCLATAILISMYL